MFIVTATDEERRRFQDNVSGGRDRTVYDAAAGFCVAKAMKVLTQPGTGTPERVDVRLPFRPGVDAMVGDFVLKHELYLPQRDEWTQVFSTLDS